MINYPAGRLPWCAVFFSQVKGHPLRKTIYEKMLSTINSKIENSHPWQLCTYNLGLIALDSGDEKKRSIPVEKSLDICLSQKSGPTIQVMALLAHVPAFRLI